MVSTLKLKNITSFSSMIPISKVISVSIGTILTKQVVLGIAKTSYSMIPVFK